MSANQPIRLLYLFDPLCGWCYAAAPAVAAMASEYGPAFEFMPSGLFAGSGARPLNDAMATHAWTNDQRIAGMTGQVFSELYRENVLARRDRPFDSGPLTLTMTAVRAVDPALEAQFLHRAQTARYVDGRDTTDPAVLAEIASGLETGLENLATRLVSDEDLATATAARIAETRNLQSRMGVSGVPALVVRTAAGDHLVHGAALYGGRDAVLPAIEAAAAA
ncbi:DsbA family protein [Microvirga arabica]|uniref:DsbA family protein n=1 Tax=Microvirga arabica TaxID=1128671 RepID=A0ABV6YB20_9HYPH